MEEKYRAAIQTVKPGRTQREGEQEEFQLHSIADNHVDNKFSVDTKRNQEGRYETTLKEMYQKTGKDAGKEFIIRTADTKEQAEKYHKEVTDYLNKGYRPAEIPPQDMKIKVFDKDEKVGIYVYPDGKTHKDIIARKYDTAWLNKDGSIKSIGRMDTIREGSYVERNCKDEKKKILRKGKLYKIEVEINSGKTAWSKTGENFFVAETATEFKGKTAFAEKDKDPHILAYADDIHSEELVEAYPYPIQAAMKAKSLFLQKERENLEKQELRKDTEQSKESKVNINTKKSKRRKARVSIINPHTEKKEWRYNAPYCLS